MSLEKVQYIVIWQKATGCVCVVVVVGFISQEE